MGRHPGRGVRNPDNIAIFEPGLSDIKDFEQIRKNIRSMTQENDEAKLLLRATTMRIKPPS